MQTLPDATLTFSVMCVSAACRNNCLPADHRGAGALRKGRGGGRIEGEAEERGAQGKRGAEYRKGGAEARHKV